MFNMKKFNEFIKESLTDKMVGKSFDDVFSYDNFKPILRDFEDEELNPNQQGFEDLVILFKKLPLLLDSNKEDLKYFVIKENSFTGDDKGNMVYVKDYIDVLGEYTKGIIPEEIKIPEFKSGMIEKILVFKDKKIAIVHATEGTMVVLNKNIFKK